MEANPIWFIEAKVLPGDTILAVWLNCSLFPLTLYAVLRDKQGQTTEAGCDKCRATGLERGGFVSTQRE